MRVAVLLVKMTGISGIISEVLSLEAYGNKIGDEYTILSTHNWKSKGLELFEKRTPIRQGDVWAQVDGKISNARKFADENAAYLNLNFDRVLMIGSCPHPNKDYGTDPEFLDLLNKLQIPVVSRMCDGYYDTYKEWMDSTLDAIDHATIAYSYRKTVEHLGIKGVHIPFEPTEIAHDCRASYPAGVWLSQWKPIKGIIPFMKALPNIQCDMDLYSCGIEYYNMRKKDMWLNAVDEDRFKGFDGRGRATYHGCVATQNIPYILAEAWYNVDLQGITKAKYKVYNDGSINTTGIEALWYGACPVVAENSPIPDDLCIKVNKDNIAERINDHLNRPRDFMINPYRQEAARRYVKQNFLTEVVYNDILGV
jgi:hypothetical protein